MQRAATIVALTMLLLSGLTATPLLIQGADAASDYRVTALDDPPSVTQGETVTLGGTVVNIGDSSGFKTVRFYVDGEVVQEERVQLDAGERERISFEYTAPQDRRGTVYFGITADGNSLYESFTVEPDMEEEQQDAGNETEMDNNQQNDNTPTNSGSDDGRLDPQLAFLIIVGILLIVGGYVAYQIVTSP